MADDGAVPGWAAAPLANWRRVAQDQRVDSVPAHLRERLAATAERVGHTFAQAAQVRVWMAGRDGADADYHRSRAAWNRTVADFERRQAAAIRSGHLLATPWHPVPDPAALRRPTAGKPWSVGGAADN